MTSLNVNGKNYQVDGPEDMQLPWFLREHLKLMGTKYACGIGECGSCTIQVDGKFVPRMDIPDKVQGKTVYGLDFMVSGMVYGVLARPPAYGAKPVSFDQKAPMQEKGVVKVMPTPHGVAVVAETLDGA